MGLVIGDLAIALVIALLIGFAVLRSSIKRDSQEAQRSAAERNSQIQQEMFLAARYKPGVPLMCAGCNTQFPGPLTDSGCPKCHSETLVLTMEEYEQRLKHITLG